MNRKQLSPGDFWKISVAEFGLWIPLDTAQPYLSALDLLARNVSKHIWHCDGGIFEKPVRKDEGQERLSLAYLGTLLVQACEAARNLPAEPRQPNKPRTRLNSTRRRKLVKDLNAVAASLSMAPADFLDEMRIVNEYINASPKTFTSLPSLTARQNELWRSFQKHITALKLATALTVLANEIAGKDYRKTPRNRGEQPETTLAAELITWLRVATGAPYSYLSGARVPKGGKSNYKVAAAFMKAAGFPHMRDDVIKRRLEARKRA